jgi:ABC-type proline/glycine betaine transport system substrate-binding protein
MNKNVIIGGIGAVVIALVFYMGTLSDKKEIKQAAVDCGTVSIAEMNWASAQLMANVDKIILSKGYGCDVSVVPGDTMPTFTSMNERGLQMLRGSSG